MKKHLQDLTEICSMMERSSRFISLSGLSGISAGVFALVGAYIAHQRILEDSTGEFLNLLDNAPLLRFIVIDGIVVLTFSLIFAFYSTARQTRKKRLKLWDNTSAFIRKYGGSVGGRWFFLFNSIATSPAFD